MGGNKISTMNELKSLIENKDWKSLSKKISPKDLAETLNFIDALLLSRKLLEDKAWDNDLQTYAIEFIKSIKKVHSKEWDKNWRHDAYLGYAYDLRGWDYEENFDTYQRAANKSIPPDPEVLMRLAMNWSCPGVYGLKINEEQAIDLLEQALAKTPYIEGVSCLIDLYDSIGDIEKKMYWEKILKESEKNKAHSPYAFLDFFDEDGWQTS